MPLAPSEIEFFRRQGYLVMPRPIAPDLLAAMTELYDHDRKRFDYCWRLFSMDQMINCDALVTSPGVDRMIREPGVLDVVTELLGGPPSFSEICLRWMKPYTGEQKQGWHRDRPHRTDHPLRVDYLQLMVYLTDVDESTHCFSISPESVDQPILKTEEQHARGGKVNLHGPAGTAILFNVSVLHSATVRATTKERKTIQIYYGLRDRPIISNDSLVPPSLWLTNPDPEARAFYGTINEKTRVYSERFGLKVDRPSRAWTPAAAT